VEIVSTTRLTSMGKAESFGRVMKFHCRRTHFLRYARTSKRKVDKSNYPLVYRLLLGLLRISKLSAGSRLLSQDPGPDKSVCILAVKRHSTGGDADAFLSVLREDWSGHLITHAGSNSNFRKYSK
jgi:hypothetical protein